jgi:hypothetical protein
MQYWFSPDDSLLLILEVQPGTVTGPIVSYTARLFNAISGSELGSAPFDALTVFPRIAQGTAQGVTPNPNQNPQRDPAGDPNQFQAAAPLADVYRINLNAAGDAVTVIFRIHLQVGPAPIGSPQGNADAADDLRTPEELAMIRNPALSGNFGSVRLRVP